MEDWNTKLLRIANEHPDAPGEVGERLRAHIQAHARQELIRNIHLTHARTREAVVNGAWLALRTGALLLSVPRDDLPTLLRAAGISPTSASEYSRLALAATDEQLQRCLRRRGRITESEALDLLHGTVTGRDLSPFDSLRALDAITDDQGACLP